MASKNTGFDLKKGQLHNIIDAKIGWVEQQLARFGIIGNSTDAVTEANAAGNFIAEISLLAEDQVQLRSSFFASTAFNLSFPHKE